MANHWLRLWHDMPNDPKWRTIARASNQSIAEVTAVYVHLLVIASVSPERGRVQINDEDIASALDLEAQQVQAILKAMQGRVLEDDVLMGWEKRQPDREDDSAARAKAWREKKKLEKQSQNQPNAIEPQDKEKETDKEADKESVIAPSVNKQKAPLIKRFAMQEGWQPDQNMAMHMLRMGFNKEETQIPSEVLTEFTCFWLTRPETQKTQEQWHHALMQAYQYKLNQGNNHAGRKRAHQKNTRPIEDTATDTSWWSERTDGQ